MRELEIGTLVVGIDADSLFAEVADFSRYPYISQGVRAVRVQPSDSGTLLSDWEVNFRNGILRWQEEDVVDWASRRIKFQQVAGDLAEFSGEWRIDERAEGTVVRFRAAFDLGIPSLAPLLEPVADRALRDNIDELIAAFAADLGGRRVSEIGNAEQRARQN